MKGLMSAVLHNFGLKVISLALAVGFWLAVARDPVAEVAVEVPIEFRNVPDNLNISSATVPRAQIWMRGPERAIHKLATSDVHAELDLSGAGPGRRTFELDAGRVRHPHELEVVQIVPSDLTVTMERTPATLRNGVPSNSQ